MAPSCALLHHLSPPFRAAYSMSSYPQALGVLSVLNLSQTLATVSMTWPGYGEVEPRRRKWWYCWQSVVLSVSYCGQFSSLVQTASAAEAYSPARVRDRVIMAVLWRRRKGEGATCCEEAATVKVRWRDTWKGLDARWKESALCRIQTHALHTRSAEEMRVSNYPSTPGPHGCCGANAAFKSRHHFRAGFHNLIPWKSGRVPSCQECILCLRGRTLVNV